MTTIDSLTDMPPSARAVDIRELPIPPYRGTRLPEIDYDAHPAYGGGLLIAEDTDGTRASRVASLSWRTQADRRPPIRGMPAAADRRADEEAAADVREDLARVR